MKLSAHEDFITAFGGDFNLLFSMFLLPEDLWFHYFFYTQIFYLFSKSRNEQQTESHWLIEAHQKCQGWLQICEVFFMLIRAHGGANYVILIYWVSSISSLSRIHFYFLWSRSQLNDLMTLKLHAIQPNGLIETVNHDSRCFNDDKDGRFRKNLRDN